jgi:hypothetical protein
LILLILKPAPFLIPIVAICYFAASFILIAKPLKSES